MKTFVCPVDKRIAFEIPDDFPETQIVGYGIYPITHCTTLALENHKCRMIAMGCIGCSHDKEKILEADISNKLKVQMQTDNKRETAIKALAISIGAMQFALHLQKTFGAKKDKLTATVLRHHRKAMRDLKAGGDVATVIKSLVEKSNQARGVIGAKFKHGGVVAKNHVQEYDHENKEYEAEQRWAAQPTEYD